MSTTPTNQPVPSEKPQDLKYNAGKIDEFVTSMAQQYIDRFGQAHYTIEGLRWIAQQAIAAFGYITLDSFEDGNTLTLPNQVLRLESTGEYYRWDGVFPKNIPAGSTPESTGGIGTGAWISVGDAALRSDLSSADITKGTSLLTYKPVSSAVSTTLSDKLWVDLKSLSDYGFGRDGNTPEQNKDAILACLADIVLPTKIVIPAGSYNVTPGIPIIEQVIVWEGQGGFSSKLFAADATNPLFTQTAALVEYTQFRNFGIGCNDLVAGINMTKANHIKIENMVIHNTVGSAIVLNGYCNDIIGNSIYSNSGNGISLGGVLNNINISRNRIYSNGAWAITTSNSDVTSGLNINIKCNNMEGNKFGAINVFNTKGLNIESNYFERNAEDGYQYADPESLLIRADIHLMSSAGTLVADKTLGNKCVRIVGNQCTSLGYLNSSPSMNGFVFSNYLDNVNISGNHFLGDDKYGSTLSIYHNNDASRIVSICSLDKNTINTVSFVGQFSDSTQNIDGAHFIKISTESPAVNFANRNMLAWVRSAGTSGQLTKSTNFYKNNFSFIVTDGDTAWSSSIDLTKSPEIKGKYVWFGAWVNDQNNASKLVLGINGKFSSTDTPPAAGDGLWKFISACILIENTDTGLNPMFKKVGTGSVLINSPSLAIIGDSSDEMNTDRTVFYRDNVPDSGTWEVGEIVNKSTPTLGQPKGWVCNVAGSPGSFNWLSLGNL
ncbi:phage tail protein [Citrobacter cronae]|uniref:tail fiber/spike domain-containing protein n=1 Tax=Citrobacter cronae TaxID=1748967 RepID=UPI00351008D1